MKTKNVYIIARPNGSGKTTFARHLKAKGYALHLYFLWIPNPELAIARIKERVSEGGHDVPAEDVRRRFTRGIYNFFNLYRPLFNSWLLFDNSKTTHTMIAKGKDADIEVVNEEAFKNFQKLAR